MQAVQPSPASIAGIAAMRLPTGSGGIAEKSAHKKIGG
jgi:hypothetical protein